MSEFVGTLLTGFGINVLNSLIWNLKNKRESVPKIIESNIFFEFYESILDKLCKEYPKLTPAHLEVFWTKEKVQVAINDYMHDSNQNRLLATLSYEFIAEAEGNYFSEEDIENILLSFFKRLEEELKKSPLTRELVNYYRVSSINNMVGELYRHFEPDFSKNIPPITTVFNLEEVPSTDGFVGRDDELEELINSDINIFVIEGISGVGKTYLFAQLASKFKSEANIFWHSLTEISTLNSILNKLLIFLELPNKSSIFEKSMINDVRLSDKINFVIEKLENKSCVLFFDDYHRIKDDNIRVLFEYFIKKTSKTRIYVTGRPEPESCFYNQLDLVHNRCVLKTLNGLKYADVERIFNLLGIDLDEKYLLKIYELTGGHPVAVELFAASVKNGYSVEELIKESPLTPDNLMDYLFDRIFFKLSSDEQDLLKSLSIFRMPVTTEALNFVYMKKNTVETAFKLFRKRLIEKNGNLYIIHPILRNPSYSLISSKKEFHKKAVDYYDAQESISLEDIIELIHHLICSEKYMDAASIAMDSNYILLQQGYVHPFLELLLILKEKDLSLKTKIYIGTVIGSIYATQREYKKAEVLFQELISISKEINYINGEASLLNNLSSIQMENGEVEEALKTQVKSLDLYNKHSDSIGKAHLILNIATSYFVCNIFEKAEKYAIESLSEINACTKSQRKVTYTDFFLECRVIGGAYNLLGKINEQKYRLHKARDYYERCNKYALISGNYSLASINSGDLGTLYAKIGYLEESEQAYLDELKYARMTHEINLIQSAYDHIGNVSSDKGDYPKAFDYYNRSLEISLSYNMFKNASTTYFHLAFDFFNQKQFSESRKYCRKSIKYAKKSKSYDCISNSFVLLARVNLEQGYEKAAFQLLDKILSYPDDITFLHQKAMAYELIGDIYSSKKNYPEAQLNYLNCMNIFESLGYWSTWILICQKTIYLCSNLNNNQDLILEYQEKLESKIPYLYNPEEVEDVYEFLIDNYLRLNHTKKIMSLFLNKINYEIYQCMKLDASKSCNKYSVYLRNEKMFDLSLHMAKIGVRLTLETKDNFILCVSYLTLGNAFQSIGQYNDALSYYSKSAILKSSMNLEEGTIKSYFNLASTYGLIENEVAQEDVIHLIIKLCKENNISFKDMMHTTAL